MYIKVGEILNSSNGTKFTKNIAISLKKVEDFTLQENQSLNIEVYRMPHGLAVIVPVQKITGSAICGRTMQSFKTEVQTTLTETHFYIEKPEFEDLEEFQMIDHKSGEIDLEPVLNEAVMLSIPSVFYKPGTKPVNQIEQPGNMPFKNLKNLF